MEVMVSEISLCWGIELAYSRLDKLAGEIGPLKATHRMAADKAAIEWDSLHLIHSGDHELIQRYPNLAGVEVVENLEALGGDNVVALGHKGLEQGLIAEAESKGVMVYNFKCPFTAKYDDKAVALAEKGYDLIVFGKPQNHHALFAKQIAERHGRVGVIAEKIDDVVDDLQAKGRKWACVGQVTGNVAAWKQFKSDLSLSGVEVRVTDTLCSDAHDRQSAVAGMAKRADTVIVVNDRGGSTVSVWERCHVANERTFYYDPHNGFAREWFADAKTVAVVAGIHVTRWRLDGIAEEIKMKFS
jgi:4-hydroxy-3-methylbut-2-enyl diphosphate reductase